LLTCLTGGGTDTRTYSHRWFIRKINDFNILVFQTQKSRNIKPREQHE